MPSHSIVGPLVPVTECKYINADIMLVIDASGSVTAPIFNTHAKAFAKVTIATVSIKDASNTVIAQEIIDRFTIGAGRTRIGIVAYAASVYAKHGLTECTDKACLHATVRFRNSLMTEIDRITVDRSITDRSTA